MVQVVSGLSAKSIPPVLLVSAVTVSGLFLAETLWAGAWAAQAQQRPRLTEWERGIALEAPGDRQMVMFLWFYEWTMFDAISPGPHNHGTFEGARSVNSGGTEAVLKVPALRLYVHAVPGGADMRLQVTNTGVYDWPELAGIVPCWSPGRREDGQPASSAFFRIPINRLFADPERNRTFFLAPDGLAPLASREIHFNAGLRAAVDLVAGGGPLAFSRKWPTSKLNAKAGLLIRESSDRKWVAGIGWEDYLSVQGHNPWNCMHVCVRVGPLRRKETKTVRGKLYLFQGSRTDCLRRFQEDFADRR